MILPKQTDSNGECIVYVEISTYEKGKRKRTRKNSGIKVLPKNWSFSKSKILSGDKLSEEKNRDIRAKFDYYNKTPLASTANQASPKSLEEFIEDYIQYRKSIGTKRSSYKEFITIKNRLIRFQKSKGVILTFEDVDILFSDELKIWHSKEGFDPNTIQKSFTTLKIIFNHYYERKEEYKINLSDTFRNKDFGKVKTHSSPPLPLTPQEFGKLIEFEKYKKVYGFSDPNNILQKVNDAFLFGCATGLRFSDLFRVNENNIKGGIIYIEPVKTETTKTENLCKIPLNEYSSFILEKYDNDTSNLKMSSQHYNRQLKKLFEYLKFNTKIKVKHYKGINEPEEKEYFKWQLLSSHNARDTFITFAIKVGIDIPSIMDMTGHSSYEVMKKYIKLDDIHLIKSMNKFEHANISEVLEPEFMKEEKERKIKSKEVKEQVDKMMKPNPKS
ncbi:tyrosine-type recombinase/integrase [Reichenbachiella sp.]